MNQRIIALAVSYSVVMGFVFAHFASAEEVSPREAASSQIKQIEKDLSEQQEELLVDGKERDILGEIGRLERDVVLAKSSLREVSNRIDKVSQQIRAGQRRAQRLNRSSQEMREYLKKRLVAFYKFGRPGYVKLLAASATLHEFQRTVKYMKVIMSQDRQILNTMSQQRSQIAREVQRLRENKAELEGLRKVSREKKRILEGSMEKKVFLLMKTHREKEFYAKAVAELKQAAQALSHKMVLLEAEQRKGFSFQNFAEMKGKLHLPLKGETLRDLGQFGANPFMHRKGVYIKGSSGDEVQSVFPGRIDYSGWFKGYGQLVIVNHGSHYFTVFAHLGERLKKTGETVSEGDTVGLVGNPGWHAGPGVYFEIRKGGNHLDPAQWLKIG